MVSSSKYVWFAGLIHLIIPGSVVRYASAIEGVSIPVVQIALKNRTGSIATDGRVNVQFSSDGTYEPNLHPLKFLWDFGDGGTSNHPNPFHVYSTGAIFDAVLTVTNSLDFSKNQSIVVDTSNSPPSLQIISPADNYIFSDGEVVTFSAVASDEETTNLAYLWEIDLIHSTPQVLCQFF